MTAVQFGVQAVLCFLLFASGRHLVYVYAANSILELFILVDVSLVLPLLASDSAVCFRSLIVTVWRQLHHQRQNNCLNHWCCQSHAPYWSLADSRQNQRASEGLCAW